MMETVVYRLGQRVESRLQRFRRFSLLVFGCLAMIAAFGVYANSNNVRFNNEQAASLGRKSARLIAPKSVHVQGSAHPGGQPASAASETASAPVNNAITVTGCGGLFGPPTVGLASASSPELRKLAQYEQLCDGALASRSSFFAPTPTTVSGAQSDANDMVNQLKAYALFGVKPLVFLEPDDDNGNDLDLVQYQAGAYDTALDSYFSDIKAAGVTDAMMGMWVVLPEGNLPEWSSVDPNVFAADVTKTVQFQKKYFPASLASIMLDSETYPSASSWNNGAYVSLLPYVQNIPKGLLDSFGLQGFPWASPANTNEASSYDPKIFLRTDLAAAAAQALGVSNIWFNTGTFHEMYAQSPAETVVTSPVSRQTILNGVVSQAEALQSQGFNVGVHLFAQNKANTSEGTDWSYWQNQPSDDPQDSAVLATFVHELAVANIPLWLFDTYDQ